MSYAKALRPQTSPSTSPCGSLMSHTTISDPEALPAPPATTSTVPKRSSLASSSSLPALHKPSYAPQPPQPPQRAAGRRVGGGTATPSLEAVSASPTVPIARRCWTDLLVKTKDEAAAPLHIETEVKAAPVQAPSLQGSLRRSVEAIGAEQCQQAREVHAAAKPLANEAWREGRYDQCLEQLNRCARGGVGAVLG